ncbi:hypothetical protein [Microbispora hainanensis]|uniref:mannan endo-1,4-beta-mannosidase n=1 Tax=Microbispora hainanensis TaxID=568844 RepID=A0ABZ1STJ8_9ACTN|nr:hypothetical protein [Microbispora hainanensis]
MRRGLRPLHLLVSPALALTAGMAAGMVAFSHTAAGAASSGFVQRCGIHFCLDGKMYYFAGANTYDVFTYGGSYGDTETQYMDKARIDAHMAELQADKVSVLRLWMFSHESRHGFEPGKGVYNDQQFALFDYVIESAKAHDIRLIPVFENYWEAYGGIDTRLRWEGLSGGHPGRAVFFDKTKCPGCFTQYKNYVDYALNRTNHYSGSPGARRVPGALGPDGGQERRRRLALPVTHRLALSVSQRVSQRVSVRLAQPVPVATVAVTVSFRRPVRLPVSLSFGPVSLSFGYADVGALHGDVQDQRLGERLHR